MSRITGLILGAGMIVLTYLIGVRVLDRKHRWFALLPAWLVGSNPSLAYWSQAGLETAAFAFVAMLAVYLFLRQSRWLVLALVLAVWLRPEGALLTGLLIVTEVVIYKRVPRYTLGMMLLALVLSLPYVGFKVLYYGSVFPNPFYAKTGLHWAQLSSGIEYAGRFLEHYGFYGLIFVVPLLWYSRLSRAARAVLLISLLYTVYIVLVGGDVLKVHRFFLPILGLVASLAAVSLSLMPDRIRSWQRYAVLAVAMVGLAALTVRLPWAWVNRFNYYEVKFIRKMRFMAEQMKQSDERAFSVAVPTIGVFGYDLLGHEIIDMVGLTDSTIARHSEEPIEGMETTWKERKHNSRYLLRRAPDYILFSTGIKPSAPAERALLLFPEFLHCYRTVGWYYQPDPKRSGTIAAVFKKMREVEGPLEPTYPVEYVQYYKKGLDFYVAGDHRQAIQYYDKALAVSPEPVNPYVLHQKAFSLMALGHHKESLALQEQVVEMDSLIFEAHRGIYTYAMILGDTSRARIHAGWLKRLVPGYWPRIEAETAGIARQAAESQRARGSRGR